MNVSTDLDIPIDNNVDLFLYNIDKTIEYININQKSDLDIKSRERENINKYKKNIYCGNCGKKGHIYKKCHYPVISLGIISFKLDKINLNTLLKKSFKFRNNKNIRLIEKFLNQNLKFFLIRRKHSLGYVEFIRGKYEFDDIDYIRNIFSIMSKEEIKNILEVPFRELWKKYKINNDECYTNV